VQIDAARRRVHDGAHTAAVKARRKRTADLLTTFDLHKPTASLVGRGRIGGLIQNGYLKKVRGGYVRTAKEFHP
jgi:lactate dehydrogenase-like 2-hydroxyacid dehydrogenase